MVSLGNEWDALLADEFKKEYYQRIRAFLKAEYANPNYPVYPEMHHIFDALKITDYHAVKAVILGQDPYHGPGQAHGLSFSVQGNTPPPPSLVNIFKEIESDLGKPMPQTGNLLRWADQGVLLLNATLTVRAHQAGSHQNKGWEEFTDAVIHRLTEERNHIVYILWGSYAQRKGAFIDASRNLILKSAHPSPLSAYRGFFGNKHFSKANDYLIATGQTPIDW